MWEPLAEKSKLAFRVLHLFRRKHLSRQMEALWTIDAWSPACQNNISGNGRRRMTLRTPALFSRRPGRTGSKRAANAMSGGRTPAVGRQLPGGMNLGVAPLYHARTRHGKKCLHGCLCSSMRRTLAC